MLYQLKDGEESKKREFVTEQLPVSAYMVKFKEEIVYEYARHTHRARWLDEQFKLRKDTFSLGIIVSVVDFAKNYTLQPQIEVQSQYYNSVQVVIFVYITFMHSPESTERD